MFDLHILKTFGIVAVSLYLVDKVMNRLIKGLNYLINRKENMKKNNQKFAERLKELRKINGLTQSQVAYGLGTKQPVYHRWETGERSPSIETLIKLADYFDVSIDYLVGRKNEK
ncbi:helix-turn-helix transcriptional regulator [Lactococcus lactis]|uniref:Helix-turn-helix transcriptional regulator n=2 Tax=Lactococcus lactis TaxID=1358 RepID=A0AAP5PF18_9LACT|nr:helix-turn-helix transcriptional regulator [Lactococcus lactis]MDT2860557.1 helix-turn-helix transcriptional regulator [Lactococcus lactis]MDT2863313.1 helix-turn-helix transcriptional regulator [Lactococcus lactis]MDT2871571.1 helix-turn-helix transcriptional regulator [Lactococcus lactis]MDT2874192.1 helix-turn-helix transcriptional regulator [Lactococcus lactis]MDT2876836.1 helix-turn-helix transcriptional regulator [Lactococcus lactis]